MDESSTSNVQEFQHNSEEIDDSSLELDNFEKDIESEEVDNSNSKNNLVQDLPDVKIKRNYNCNWCGYFTQNPRDYLYHMKNVHDQRFRIYECPECVYASRHSQKLQRHYKMIHDKKNSVGKSEKSPKSQSPKSNFYLSYSAPVSPHRFVTGQSPKDHSDSEVFPLEKTEIVDNTSEINNENNQTICNEQVIHEKNIKTSDLIKCSLCSFKTKSTLLMKRHEAVAHLKKKFYRCKKCNYVTWVKARFTKHMKYHNMPMVKCDLCDFRTPYKWNLDRHMKNHVGGGLFKCQKCNFTAHIRQSLTFHIQHHHLKRGESVTRRIRKKPTLNEMPFYDYDNIEEIDDSEYINSTLSSQTIEGKEKLNKEKSDPLSSKNEKNVEIHEDNCTVDDKISQKKSSNKIQPKIKIILKKNKIKHHNERHNFGPDFIHPDDIVQKNGQVFIKDIKCEKCNFKTAFEVDLLRHHKKVHESDKAKKATPNINQTLMKEESSAMILKIPQIMKTQETISEAIPINNHVTALNRNESNLNENLDLYKQEINVKNECENSDADISKISEKRPCSFFDHLKQKLTQNDANKLICNECSHESKCLSEALNHKKVHLKSEKSNFSNISRGTRCQFCRRRCKTEIDLIHHEKVCDAAIAYKNKEENIESSISKVLGMNTEPEISESFESLDIPTNHKKPHPMENKVFVWNKFSSSCEHDSMNFSCSNEWENKEENSSRPTSSSSFYNESVGTPDSPSINDENEEEITYNNGTEIVKMKKVYKCPDCSFWATTASRFHVHIVGHLNMKPFKCSACSYKSNWRWDITKHIRLKANRDEVHNDAVVMMTDNSGERNYEKYEKYVTLMSLENRGANFRNSDLMSKRKARNVTRFAGKRPSRMITNEIKKLDGKVSFKNNHLELSIGKLMDSSKQNSTNFMLTNSGVSCLKNPDFSQSSSKETQHFSLMKCFSSPSEFSQLAYSPNRDVTISSNNRPKTMNSQYLDNFSQSQFSSNYDIQPEVSIYPTSKINDSQSDVFPVAHFKKKDNKPLLSRKRLFENNGRPEPEKTKIFVTDQGIPKKTTVWKCKKCNYRSNNKETILKHIREHYIDKNTKLALPLFKCGYCEQFSNWKHVIQRHCRLKHNGNISVIENNSKISQDTTNEDSHVDSNESRDMCYQCKICPYVCKKRQEMKVHLQTHIQRPDAIFKCMFCPYYVSVKRALHQHMRLHGVKEPQQFLAEVLERNVRAADEEKFNNKKSTILKSEEILTNDEIGKRFQCFNCPYVTNSRSQFLYHKQFHRPMRSSQYKCNFCTYNVSRRHLLNQHLRVHQQEDDQEKKREQNGPPIGSRLQSALQGETQPRGDIPLVWVSRDNRFYKMFKCHYCPHVNLRKSNIHEHEKMHGRKLNGHMHTCTLCNYSCSNPGVIAVHMRVHGNKLGKLHGPVDNQRSDADQVREISQSAILGSPSDFAKHRSENNYSLTLSECNCVQYKKPVLYFCQFCPARFAKDTEIEIHKKLHSLKLQFKCEICDYNARQEPHLLAHMKVHSDDYLKKTVHLLRDHVVSNQYPIPDMVLAEIPPDCRISFSKESVQSKEEQEEFHYKSQNINADKNTTELNISTLCNKEKNHPCPKCPAKFIKPATLAYHLGLHGSGGQYKCDRKECDYSVNTIGNLVRHQTMHNQYEALCKKNNNSKSEITYNNVSDIYKNNNLMEFNKRRFRKYDDVPMSGVDLLKRKLEYQHEQNKCHNETKENISESPKNYNRHDDPARIGNPAFVYPTVIKNGKIKEKRYKCPKCPTALEKRDQYKIHLTLHGAKNKYTCEKCAYSVKYYANYLQHIEKHQRFEEVLRKQGTPVNDPTVARPADSTIFYDGERTDHVNLNGSSVCINISTPNQILNHEIAITQPLTLVERQQLILQELKQKSTLLKEEKKIYFCSYCPFSSLKRDHQKSHSFRHINSGVRSHYNCCHCDYSAPQLHFLREHIKCHFKPQKNALKPEAFLMLEAVDIIGHLEGTKHDENDVKENRCYSLFRYKKSDETNHSDNENEQKLDIIDLMSGEFVKNENLSDNPSNSCKFSEQTVKKEDCNINNIFEHSVKLENCD